MAADDAAHEGGGRPLDAVSARLAAPFARGDVGRDLFGRQGLEGDAGVDDAAGRLAASDHDDAGEDAVIAARQQFEEALGLGLVRRLFQQAAAQGDDGVSGQDDGVGRPRGHYLGLAARQTLGQTRRRLEPPRSAPAVRCGAGSTRPEPASEPKGQDATRASLLEAVGDTALGQVVRGHFDQDLVAGEDADVVLAHLAGDMGDDFVPIFQRTRKVSRAGLRSSFRRSGRSRGSPSSSATATGHGCERSPAQRCRRPGGCPATTAATYRARPQPPRAQSCSARPDRRWLRGADARSRRWRPEGWRRPPLWRTACADRSRFDLVRRGVVQMGGRHARGPTVGQVGQHGVQALHVDAQIAAAGEHQDDPTAGCLGRLEIEGQQLQRRFGQTRQAAALDRLDIAELHRRHDARAAAFPAEARQDDGQTPGFPFPADVDRPHDGVLKRGRDDLQINGVLGQQAQGLHRRQSFRRRVVVRDRLDLSAHPPRLSRAAHRRRRLPAFLPSARSRGPDDTHDRPWFRHPRLGRP
uniref:LigA n=1 Tax=Parastrongyloides trichosuri TaxID=131310 RepID=A0A0N4Z8I8_PARTI